jgi:hypothetical protein
LFAALAIMNDQCRRNGHTPIIRMPDGHDG